MAVTVEQSEEATVVTIKADGKSSCPPLCQILGTLCYSPACCFVYKGMMNPCVTAVLGTIQIMLGLFNIALGPGRPVFHYRDLTGLGASYWLGVVYATVGIISILAGQFPSRCLVGLTVFMNIVGAVFAFTGIVLYSVELHHISSVWDWTLNNGERIFLTNIDAVSIILAAVQLCVCIIVSVQGIKALVKKKKEEEVGFTVLMNIVGAVFAMIGIVLFSIDLTIASKILVMSTDAASLTMAAVQLFICSGIVVLGIRALSIKKKEEEGDKDAKDQLPEVKALLRTSPHA